MVWQVGGLKATVLNSWLILQLCPCMQYSTYVDIIAPTFMMSRGPWPPCSTTYDMSRCDNCRSFIGTPGLDRQKGGQI